MKGPARPRIHASHADAVPAAKPKRTTRSATKAPAARPAGEMRKAPLAAPRRAGWKRVTAPTMPEASSTARDLALAIATAGLDKKAVGIEILDVSGKVDYADFLVVMTGRSDRHVQSIATGIEGALRDKKVRALSSEGMASGTWVLIDFGDVVVHVFQEDARRLYDIEGLWMDADRVPVKDDAPAGVSSPSYDLD